MVKRKATKGPNAGKEFYGCSNYPRCRCIINIQ
jgi:restriction system protein